MILREEQKENGKMTQILIWVLIWTLVSFALMGIDKWKAGRHGQRVPEKVLFLTAALGGSVGAMVGMSLFRHKTRHWSFKLGMPAILGIQIILALTVSYANFR